MAHEIDEEMKIDVEIPDYIIQKMVPEEWYDEGRYNESTMAPDGLFKTLEITQNGLTINQSRIRLEKFAPNEQLCKTEHSRFQFLRFLGNPFTWIMEVTAIVAIIVSNGDEQTLNWKVIVSILLLLFINLIIGFITRRSSQHLMKACLESSEMEVKVKQDGKWPIVDESDFVPGDIISIKQDSYNHANDRIISEFD